MLLALLFKSDLTLHSIKCLLSISMATLSSQSPIYLFSPAFFQALPHLPFLNPRGTSTSCVCIFSGDRVEEGRVSRWRAECSGLCGQALGAVSSASLPAPSRQEAQTQTVRGWESSRSYCTHHTVILPPGHGLGRM